MPLPTNSAEGGTAGTTVTTANSGGASGQPWDGVGIAAGGSLTYDNAQAAHGNLSYLISQLAAGQTFLQWSSTGQMASASQAWFRAYVRLPSLPTNGIGAGTRSGSTPGTVTTAAGGASLVLTWTVNPVAGHTILVEFSTANVVGTVTDNGRTSSAFTLDASKSDGTHTTYLYRANNITLPASGQYKVTVAFSSGTLSAQGGGMEFSGVKAGPPTATNTGTATSTAVSTGAVTPAAAGALYWAAFEDESALNPETITLTGSGFNGSFVQTNGSSFVAGANAWKIDSGGPTATACTWTLGDSVTWGAVIAVYDAAPNNWPLLGVNSGGTPNYLQVNWNGALNFVCQGVWQPFFPLNISPGQWFRVEGYILAGTTAGAVELKLFAGDNWDGTVPDYTQTLTGLNTAAGPYTNFDFGVLNATANVGPYWLDDVAWSTFGYIGPANIPFFPPAQPAKAEIQINGQWVDISAYLRENSQIVIQHGRADEAATIQTASCNLELDNRDQRFSPLNTSGPYYPFLTRNTQLRISVKAQNNGTPGVTGGYTYSGFRFWGEIPSWAQRWDISQHNIFVHISASGIWRRLAQNSNNAGSALFRYYTKGGGLSDGYVSVWPCEDMTAATQIANAVSGGPPMTWTTKPSLSSDTSIPGSDAFLQLSSGVLSGTVAGNSITPSPALYTTPGSYQWVCPGDVSTVKAECWGGGGGGGGHSSAVGCAGGGGGEYAMEPAVGVSSGQSYTVVVGQGGGDQQSGFGSTFTGDSLQVVAHGGGRGLDVFLGAGGTGSGNNTHFDGGVGGHGNNAGGGGGGGSSGGTGSAGNAGGNSPGSTGGSPGAAVTGGGIGGWGNASGFSGVAPVSGPGGAGGGAGKGTTRTGGNGYAGQVQLTYTTSLAPVANAVTFLLDVPSGGATNGSILFQYIATGTAKRLDVIYNTAGTLTFTWWNDTAGTILNSTFTPVQNFKGFPCAIRLLALHTPGNVAYSAYFAKPGDLSWTQLGLDGTNPGDTVGTVSTINLNAGSTLETTAVGIGGIAVAYQNPADNGFFGALNAYQAEHALDRVIRLCGEEGIPTPAAHMPTWGSVLNNPTPTNHWWFSTDLNDHTSAGNNGTGTNTSFALDGPPTFTGGQGVHSVSFNGSSSVVVTTAVPTTLSHFSIAFWINLDGRSPGGIAFPQIVASSDTSTTLKGFQVFYNKGTQQIGINLGNSTTFSGPCWTPVFQTSGWQFIVFTYDQTTCRCYYNGQLVMSGTPFGTGGTLAFDSFGITMGASVNPSGRGNWLNGKLAEVAFWPTTTLTATAIQQMYQANSGALMGPQTDEPIATLLQECEDVDKGLLHETRGSFGLTYRPRVTMQNQAPGCTLDYNNSQIGQPIPQPEADDQLTHNDIVLSRRNGSTASAILNSGALSVQPPPAGVGPYALQETFNFYNDGQLPYAAQWLLSLGTVSDFRWPIITPTELERMAGQAFSLLPALDEGDHVRILNPPAWVIASGNADQLAFGFTEVIQTRRWAIQLNTVPELPYEGTSLPVW